MKKVLLTGLLILSVLYVRAQVPITISFQGYLTDKTTGDPIKGNRDMKFSLFDASTGGAELWFDEYASVPVTDGLFSVTLGDKKPIALPFDQAYYVQIKVGTEPLTDRLRLNSSGYSISSTNASNISQGNLSVAYGGTGAATLTGIVVGNGSGAMTTVAKTGGNQYLRSNAGNTGYEFVELTGTLTNDDVADDAAIAGTKVVPSFGDQDITTTGTVTAETLNGFVAAANIKGILAGSKVDPSFGDQDITTTGILTATTLNGSLATSNITGTLDVDNGGTGATNLTGVLFGNGTSAFTALASGTGNRYLRRNVANSAYEFVGLAVQSSEITDNTIVDADIFATAAIAGTKINPDFGNKNIVTTGNLTANTLSGSLSAASLTGSNNLPTGVLPTTVPLGNGAAGRVALWTGTSAVSSSAALNWDNLNSRLGVGTASPGVTMHVSHGSGFTTNGLTIENNTIASSNWNFYVNASGDLALYKAGSIKGTFLSTGGTYSPSDRRLKKDIEPIGDIMAGLMRLTPSMYRFKDQDAHTPKLYGFIAQDVMELFPSLVNHNSEADIYTLDYSGFGVLAVKAIQEQQQKIDDLTNQIMELKRAVEALQSNLKK